MSRPQGWESRAYIKGQESYTRYPGYNVLDKWSSPDWDDQTRRAVRRRLEEIPPIRFFNEHEARTLDAVAGRIVPQPDRNESEKAPIAPWVDEKLYEDKRDGYRDEELPPQREAWRRGYSGPSSPRGHVRKREGGVDPWEAQEGKAG